MVTRTLAISGMHCQACVKRLTDAFLRVPSVTSAHVSLSPPQVRIESDIAIPLATLQSAAMQAGDYTLHESGVPHPPDSADATATRPASLYPLFLIVAFIAGVVLLAGAARANWSWASLDAHDLMLNFMAGFFLVFSFFKLLDLRGFADAYQTYDVLARPVRGWAYAYPFIELALGVAYLTRWNLPLTNAATLALMLLGAVGVLKALLSKRTIRCACLGTALNLPMTTLTLVEDLTMAAMAGAALLWNH